MPNHFVPGLLGFAFLAAHSAAQPSTAEPVTILSQAVAPSSLTGPSFVSVAFMFGGHRSPACDVGVELCYRNDAADAPLVVWVTLSSLSGSGEQAWTLQLGNGWCSFATLAAVPDAASLTLSYSFTSASPTAPDLAPAYTLAAPAAADCATQLASPAVTPAGGSSLGPVVITLDAATADEAVSYSLSGAESTVGGPLAYAGPFVLAQCGTTVLSAVASEPGVLDSAPAVASFTVRVTPPGSSATCLDVSPVPAGDAGAAAASLALLGGERDAACEAVVRVRYVDPSSAAAGAAASFIIAVSTPGHGVAKVPVTAAQGYDTTLSLGVLLPGSPVLQLLKGGSPVGEPVTVPDACAPAAAAPVFSLPNGTSVAAPGTLSITVSSSTPGAFLYVSLDGSDPTLQASTSLLWAQDAPGVDGPSVAVDLSLPGCVTLLAYAARGDLQPSPVVSATYCVNGGAVCDPAAGASIVCFGGDCSPLFFTCDVGGVVSGPAVAPAGSLCVGGAVSSVSAATCPNNACYLGAPAAFTLGQGRNSACSAPVAYPAAALASDSASVSASATASATSAPTLSASSSSVPTTSATASTSASVSASRSLSASPSSSATASASRSPSASASAAAGPAATLTATGSASSSASTPPVGTPTTSASMTASASASGTATATATATGSATATGTATATGSATATMSGSATKSSSASSAPTATATATASASASGSQTASASVSASHVPAVLGAPDCSAAAPGYYCIWAGAEAAFRAARLQAQLPPSPCSSTYVECVSGAMTAVLRAPAGTVCLNGSFAAATDASCIAPPSASPSPGSLPSPLPPNSCLSLDDGVYCAANATEAAARAAATAAGAFVPPCYAHFFECFAGSGTPLMPVPPGALCADGAFVLAGSAQCAAPGTRSPACPGPDGIYCASPPAPGTSCSQSWYQCVGGQPTASQPVAPGTACYTNASAAAAGPLGTFVAAAYGPCLPDTAAARCDPGADEIVCTDPVAPTSPCGTALHRCYYGTPSASWAAPPGTLCLGGALVFNNDEACNVTAGPLQAPANVTVTVNASGLTAADLLSPLTGSTVRSVIAACASGDCSAAGNSTDVNVSTSDVYLGASDSGISPVSNATARRRQRRLLRSNPGLLSPAASCPRVLASTNILALLAGTYVPRGPARPGVHVTTRNAAGGALGIGSARLSITLSASSGAAAAAAADALQAALFAPAGAAAGTAASAALRAAGLGTLVAASRSAPAVQVAAAVVPGGAATPSTAPNIAGASSQSSVQKPGGLGAGAIAGIAVGCAAAVAGAALAVAFVARKRSKGGDKAPVVVVTQSGGQDSGFALSVVSTGADTVPLPPRRRSSATAAAPVEQPRRQSLATGEQPRRVSVAVAGGGAEQQQHRQSLAAANAAAAAAAGASLPDDVFVGAPPPASGRRRSSVLGAEAEAGGSARRASMPSARSTGDGSARRGSVAAAAAAPAPQPTMRRGSIAEAAAEAGGGLVPLRRGSAAAAGKPPQPALDALGAAPAALIYAGASVDPQRRRTSVTAGGVAAQAAPPPLFAAAAAAEASQRRVSAAAAGERRASVSGGGPPAVSAAVPLAARRQSAVAAAYLQDGPQVQQQVAAARRRSSLAAAQPLPQPQLPSAADTTGDSAGVPPSAYEPPPRRASLVSSSGLPLGSRRASAPRPPPPPVPASAAGAGRNGSSAADVDAADFS